MTKVMKTWILMTTRRRIPCKAPVLQVGTLGSEFNWRRLDLLACQPQVLAWLLAVVRSAVESTTGSRVSVTSVVAK